jgi:hypothetical protein
MSQVLVIPEVDYGGNTEYGVGGREGKFFLGDPTQERRKNSRLKIQKCILQTLLG